MRRRHDARELSLAAGDRLIVRGKAAEDFYIIVDGELRVTIEDALVIAMRPGEMVGELAILSDAPRAADVHAETAANPFAIHRGDLAELMADRPEIAPGIIAELSARIAQQGLPNRWWQEATHQSTNSAEIPAARRASSTERAWARSRVSMRTSRIVLRAPLDMRPS